MSLHRKNTMRKQLDGELSVRHSLTSSASGPYLLPSVSVYGAHFMKNSRILGPPHALPESKTDPCGASERNISAKFQDTGAGSSVTCCGYGAHKDTVGMADKAKYLNCYKNQRQEK